LMDLSRVIPSDAYLDTFTATITGPPAATTGGTTTTTPLIGTMITGGQAIGFDSLSIWLTRLELVQGWVNPWMPTITANAKVHNRIPPTADEPGLILLLQNAAISAGIDLVSLSPGTPVLDTTSGLSKITVSVSATGTYFDVTDFMYQIETLPRAAIVTNLSLAPGGTGGTGVPLLTLTATVQTYTSDTSAGPGSQ